MDEKETLGKFLKSQRESKKISLREVSKNTRVREPILKAIEEDKHELLPPATYVKGFLLAYARYLRLDLNDILLRYESSLKGEPVAPPSPHARIAGQKISSPPPAKKIKQKFLWNTKQLWVIVGVVLASFVVFYFFSPYASKPLIETIPGKSVERKISGVASPPPGGIARAPEGKPTVEGKAPPVSSPPVAAVISVEEKKTEDKKAEEKKKLSLQIKAAEETWVSLAPDDQPQKEMTFKPGDGLSIQASHQIRMRLGNAGGVDLILNGRPMGKFGKSGEVLTLVITPQGIEVKASEKPKAP